MNEHPMAAVNFSIQGSGPPYPCIFKTAPTAVAVNVRQTIISDLAMGSHAFDDVPEFEKLVRVLYTAVAYKY